MKLYIDTDEMDELGLDPMELWVLQTLRVLCHNKPWSGSYRELARICQCGGKSSICRYVSKLIELGYVVETEDGLMSQNGTDVSQNGTKMSPNGTNSKRKEPKEKDYNNYINSLNNPNEEKEREIFNLLNFPNMEPINSENKTLPENTELYKIIVGEKGYLQPRQYIRSMTEYYNAMGWPKGTKEDVMRLWMSGVSSKHHREPEMTERERAYMKKFLTIIEQRLIVRFFDILVDFQLENDLSIFYFHEEHMQNVAKWMTVTGLVDKMTEFASEIKIRRA